MDFYGEYTILWRRQCHKYAIEGKIDWLHIQFLVEDMG
jgi:hypothetical protein